MLALLTSCCPFTGIGFGILAIILGLIGKNQTASSGAGTAAAVLGALAFIISVGFLAFWLAARVGN